MSNRKFYKKDCFISYYVRLCYYLSLKLRYKVYMLGGLCIFRILKFEEVLDVFLFNFIF